MGRSPKINRFYEVKGAQLARKRRECPRCGRGVFLAEHSNRFSCGRCGYTLFKQSPAEGTQG